MVDRVFEDGFHPELQSVALGPDMRKHFMQRIAVDAKLMPLYIRADTTHGREDALTELYPDVLMDIAGHQAPLTLDAMKQILAHRLHIPSSDLDKPTLIHNRETEEKIQATRDEEVISRLHKAMTSFELARSMLRTFCAAVTLQEGRPEIWEDAIRQDLKTEKAALDSTESVDEPTVRAAVLAGVFENEVLTMLQEQGSPFTRFIQLRMKGNGPELPGSSALGNATLVKYCGGKTYEAKDLRDQLISEMIGFLGDRNLG